jgi:hypothetical protein
LSAFTAGFPNRARIAWTAGVGVADTVTIDPAVSSEWYLCAINILRSRTTTCAGCEVPACPVLNEVRVFRTAEDPRPSLFLRTPATSAHVTWQGGGGLSCPGAMPTRDRTWGQVKQMYR